MLGVGALAIIVCSHIGPSAGAASGSSAQASEGLGLSRTVDAVLSGEDPVPATSAPSWFEEEFFSPATFFDIRCNEEETVVSLQSADPALSTLRACVEAMERRGWTTLSTGRELMKTMIRKDGDHTWAMLWAIDVGGQCSIVVQTLPGR